MRPYLAIIKDAFREALSNKILWLTLLLITIFLLLIAPVGFEEDQGTRIGQDEVLNWLGLIDQLQSTARRSEPSAEKHLWSLLSDEQRERAERVVRETEEARNSGPPRRFREQQRFLEILNSLVQREDFYSPEAWKNVTLSDELLNSWEASAPKSSQRAAVQRRMLGVVFSRHLDLARGGDLYATYLGFRPFDRPLPFGPEILKEVLQAVLAGMISVIFGWLGTVVAIIVTASIMPRTFEPGEITLLLSKPISRPGLYVARFLGGCAFTLVNVAYLLVGLWLIAGLRFGIWNHGLLLGIPVYVFLFAVYFSVSALVGVRWGNAIIAVCVAIGFSLFLQALFIVKQTCEFFLAPQNLRTVLLAGEDVLAVNSARETLLWDSQLGDWKPVFTSGGRGGAAFERRVRLVESPFRPRVKEEGAAIVALNPVGGWTSNEVIEARRDGDWQRESLGRLNDAITELLVDPQGKILCVGTAGIYEFVPADPEEAARAAVLEAATGGFWKPAVKTGTREIHPADFERVRREDSSALNPLTGEILIYRKGELTRYGFADSNSSRLTSSKLAVPAHWETTAEPPAALVAAGLQTLVAFADGTITVLGEEPVRYRPFPGIAPAALEVSADGRWFGLVTHDGRAWLYDARSSHPAVWKWGGQGNIATLGFSGTSHLLLADQRDRVRVIDLDTSSVERTLQGPLTVLERSYDWGVAPLYALLPKPSELDRVVQTLVTGETSRIFSEGPRTTANLRQEQVVQDQWFVVLTSLAFIVFMVGLGCWQIASRDF